MSRQDKHCWIWNATSWHCETPDRNFWKKKTTIQRPGWPSLDLARSWWPLSLCYHSDLDSCNSGSHEFCLFFRSRRYFPFPYIFMHSLDIFKIGHLQTDTKSRTQVIRTGRAEFPLVTDRPLRHPSLIVLHHVSIQRSVVLNKIYNSLPPLVQSHFEEAAFCEMSILFSSGWNAGFTMYIGEKLVICLAKREGRRKRFLRLFTMIKLTNVSSTSAFPLCLTFPNFVGLWNWASFHTSCTVHSGHN